MTRDVGAGHEATTKLTLDLERAQDSLAREEALVAIAQRKAATLAGEVDDLRSELASRTEDRAAARARAKELTGEVETLRARHATDTKALQDALEAAGQQAEKEREAAEKQYQAAMKHEQEMLREKEHGQSGLQARVRELVLELDGVKESSQLIERERSFAEDKASVSQQERSWWKAEAASANERLQKAEENHQSEKQRVLASTRAEVDRIRVELASAVEAARVAKTRCG